jgi:hypothetical protein
LSYTNSITTGNEESIAESERIATDRTGKLFTKSIAVLDGLTESARIKDNIFDIIVP